jgi:hypothetical protein
MLALINMIKILLGRREEKTIRNFYTEFNKKLQDVPVTFYSKESVEKLYSYGQVLKSTVVRLLTPSLVNNSDLLLAT